MFIIDMVLMESKLKSNIYILPFDDKYNLLVSVINSVCCSFKIYQNGSKIKKFLYYLNEILNRFYNRHRKIIRSIKIVENIFTKNI